MINEYPNIRNTIKVIAVKPKYLLAICNYPIPYIANVLFYNENIAIGANLFILFLIILY